MAIPVEKLRAIVAAGHPDEALIGLPVSLVRELLRALPIAIVDAATSLAHEPVRSAGETA